MATSDKRDSNNLRVEMYRKLIPKIIEEDLRTGVTSPINFWDDPNFNWDDFIWDDVGVMPVIKNMFYVLETIEGEELAISDTIPNLSNPDLVPEKFLDLMAESLALPLNDDISVPRKRELIKSAMELHKIRGTNLSWKVFYRLIGFDIKLFELHKKDIEEANGNYSRVQFEVTDVVETFGTAGVTSFAGKLQNVPILPNSVRIEDGNNVYRDDGSALSSNFGKIIGTTGNVIGEINYSTGKFKLDVVIASTQPLEFRFQQIVNEFPYKAARVDLEIFAIPDEDNNFVTPINEEFTRKLINRIEDVRPIHVLLRALIIVLPIQDVLSGFAADSSCCNGPEMAKDVRDTEFRFYAADALNVRSGDSLLIERSDTTEREQILEEAANFAVNPLDSLTIEFSDSQPTRYE